MAPERPAFGTALRGYDCAEVDALVDQIEQTLAGGPALTADAVRSALFRIVVRGYREDEVDDYLDQVVAELEHRSAQSAAPSTGPVAESWTDLVRERAELLRCAEQPAGQRFERAGAFRSGYAVEEVDAFVDRMRRGLGAGRVETAMLAAEARAVVFSSSRRGYEEDNVDAWLNQLDSYLHRAERAK